MVNRPVKRSQRVGRREARLGQSFFIFLSSMGRGRGQVVSRDFVREEVFIGWMQRLRKDGKKDCMRREKTLFVGL